VFTEHTPAALARYIAETTLNAAAGGALK